jgi:uncharacterized membrane protein YcaP (DUF421 family)
MDLARIAVRALFAWLFLLGLLRLSGKRSVAQSTTVDFVLALVLGDLIDDALWAEVSLGRFVAASGTMVLLEVVLDMLCARFPRASSVLQGDARVVVQDGEPLPSALRAERLHADDLAALLRGHGLDRADWSDVRTAWLAEDGSLQVSLRNEARAVESRDRDRLPGAPA